MGMQLHISYLHSFAPLSMGFTRLENIKANSKYECTPSLATNLIPPNKLRVKILKKPVERGQYFVAPPTYSRIDVGKVDVELSAQSVPTSFSARWRDIQGANNWEGLLDPIDRDLREELIRYGEFAQICYDAFDSDKNSIYCGSCKYSKRKVLEKVGLRNAADYEVTKYLYSTSDLHLPHFFQRSQVPQERPWSRDSNWMGFVAVSKSASEIQRLGRRDIVVAWRGTLTIPEWISNLEDWLSPSSFCPRSQAGQAIGDVKVERGFRSIYTSKKESSRYNRESAQEQLLSEIRRLLKEYHGQELSITITGHSLGGALALLSAYDIAESEINKRNIRSLQPSQQRCDSTNRSIDTSLMRYRNGFGTDASESIPITVFTFAGPRVGNDAFRDRCEELGIKTLRVVNEKDVVPKVPGVVLNEHMHVLRSWIDKLPWTYSHVGLELALSTQDSSCLQWSFLDVAGHHNLEAYLHLLDAYRSTQERFSGHHRDLALVNKFSELLKPKYCIPPYWWQEQNKGLQKNAQGRWVQREREKEHIPSEYSDL